MVTHTRTCPHFRPSGTNAASQPHSASKTHLRVPRFITNPPVTLKAPLNLNRPDRADYVRAFLPANLPSLPFPSLSTLLTAELRVGAHGDHR